MSAHLRLVTKQLTKINKDVLFWTFPGLVTLGWILWPCIDYEYKMEMGWAPDPEAAINRVQAEKDQRLAAKMKLKPAVSSKEEEEEAEEEAAEEEEAAAEEEEEETSGGGGGEDAGDDEDVPAAEDGDDEDEGESGGVDEDEEESEEAPPPPLYLPTKAEKLSTKDVWDNFTLKAVNMVCVRHKFSLLVGLVSFLVGSSLRLERSASRSEQFLLIVLKKKQGEDDDDEDEDGTFSFLARRALAHCEPKPCLTANCDLFPVSQHRR